MYLIPSSLYSKVMMELDSDRAEEVDNINDNIQPGEQSNHIERAIKEREAREDLEDPIIPKRSSNGAKNPSKVQKDLSQLISLLKKNTGDSQLSKTSFSFTKPAGYNKSRGMGTAPGFASSLYDLSNATIPSFSPKAARAARKRSSYQDKVHRILQETIWVPGATEVNCPLCNRKLKTKTGFINHMAGIHPEVTAHEDSIGPSTSTPSRGPPPRISSLKSKVKKARGKLYIKSIERNFFISFIR